MVQPAELLARLVNVLGYIPPVAEDTGADNSNQTTFVHQDIGHRSNKLEESNGKEHREKESNTGSGIGTIAGERIPAYRSRATSEIKLYETKNEDRNIEWTWSGPTTAKKVRELMKSRTSEPSDREQGSKERKFSKLGSFASTRSVSKAPVSSAPWKGRFSTSSEKKNSKLDREINRDNGQSFASESAISSIDDRRDSTTWNLRRHYHTHTGADDTGNPNAETANHLLEETSLADLLRALTVLRASVATNSSWTSVANADQFQRDQPRRKMGIASSTPPKLPSLFTLFSASPPTSTTTENATTQESYSNKLLSSRNRRDSRRGSWTFVTPTIGKSRRFSLRPVATPVGPPTPPKTDSPRLSVSRAIHRSIASRNETNV